MNKFILLLFTLFIFANSCSMEETEKSHVQNEKQLRRENSILQSVARCELARHPNPELQKTHVTVGDYRNSNTVYSVAIEHIVQLAQRTKSIGEKITEDIGSNAKLGPSRWGQGRDLFDELVSFGVDREKRALELCAKIKESEHFMHAFAQQNLATILLLKTNMTALKSLNEEYKKASSLEKKEINDVWPQFQKESHILASLSSLQEMDLFINKLERHATFFAAYISVIVSHNTKQAIEKCYEFQTKKDNLLPVLGNIEFVDVSAKEVCTEVESAIDDMLPTSEEFAEMCKKTAMGMRNTYNEAKAKGVSAQVLMLRNFFSRNPQQAKKNPKNQWLFEAYSDIFADIINS